VFARVAALAPGELQVQTLHGDLLGPIHARGVVYRDARTELRIGELVLDWQPGALLRATWHITRLDLDDVQLRRRRYAGERRARATACAATRCGTGCRPAHARHITLDETDSVTLARAELSGSGDGTRVRLTQIRNRGRAVLRRRYRTDRPRCTLPDRSRSALVGARAAIRAARRPRLAAW